ncbi:MAG: hypothetical protein OHK0037_40430 [Elainellaceae cyanobacterium]
MPKPLLPYRIVLGLVLSLGLGLSGLATGLVHRWETANGLMLEQLDVMQHPLQDVVFKTRDILIDVLLSLASK